MIYKVCTTPFGSPAGQEKCKMFPLIRSSKIAASSGLKSHDQQKTNRDPKILRSSLFAPLAQVSPQLLWSVSMNFRISVIIFFLACVLVAAASGQTAIDTGNGFKPYGSFDGSNLDSVNLQNGNFLLHAPLLPSYPQRGGHFNPQAL